MVEALAGDTAEQIVLGQPQTVHDEFGGVDALIAHLLDLARNGQTRTHLAEAFRLLDQEGGHLLVDGCVRICAVITAHEHRDEGRGATVREPHLLAGEHEVVAIAHRLTRDRCDIGTTPGFGHAECATDFTGRHARQVPLLLLFRAVLHKHVGDDEVGIDDTRHTHPAAGDLFDDEGVGRQ